MANSINTNRGALVALQTLNATNKALETTQNRVNTGMKVSSAKDNGAIFAIATSQRAEMGAQDAVKQSLQRGQSIVDVALAAGETVVAALTELKSLAVAIQDAPETGDTQTKLHADFTAITNEITTALAGATFDGVNLFLENDAAIDVTINTASSGNKFTLKAVTAEDTNPLEVSIGADDFDLSVPDKDNRTAAAVDAAINSFTSILADFGTKSKSLDRQLAFVGKLQDSLETGIGNLVDADLAKESARLTALQTKQQLGVQALSIANSSSSILLGLFR
ncbi:MULTISPECIES: flagellin [unclassified Brevundimonas]|uniref:flagellin N-terminal helical domain-containing protein n=1 Tax=unclassified Brevundimonas TaxID=2622653 RepID=UPI0025BAF646|nr:MULTISPECIES: flagellin [unclassified Brevundimonas]